MSTKFRSDCVSKVIGTSSLMNTTPRVSLLFTELYKTESFKALTE